MCSTNASDAMSSFSLSEWKVQDALKEAQTEQRGECVVNEDEAEYETARYGMYFVKSDKVGKMEVDDVLEATSGCPKPSLGQNWHKKNQFEEDFDDSLDMLAAELEGMDDEELEDIDSFNPFTENPLVRQDAVIMMNVRNKALFI